MKLMLGTVAARFVFWTQRLDLEHVSCVRGEVVNLDGAFLQNEDSVGGHIPLSIVIL